MKPLNVVVTAILVSVAVTFAVMRLSPHSALPHKETSFERVLRTGTIRCGYEYWDSGIMQDPASGKLHGTWVDILEEIGKVAALKIEWAEHVGWGDVGAALKSGKIDAMCAGMWQSTEKAKEMAFSLPLAYQSIEAFARADETRFDKDLSRINSEDVNIVVIDADTSDFLAREDFPKAKRTSLSQLNGTDAEQFLALATNKADVTFDTPGLWRQFDKANPGKVRRVAPGHDLRVFGMSVVVDNDDPRFVEMLDVAAQEIVNSGSVDRILAKTDADYPDMYLKTVKPYRE